MSDTYHRRARTFNRDMDNALVHALAAALASDNPADFAAILAQLNGAARRAVRAEYFLGFEDGAVDEARR